MELVRQRAALIAAAAAGTPLPPLSSLTPDEQRQYFEWIKQLPVNASAFSTDISLLPFTAAKLFSGSTSLPKDTFDFMGEQMQPLLSSTSSIGAIGSGRPRNNIPPKLVNIDQNCPIMLQKNEPPIYLSQPSLSRSSVSTINDSAIDKLDSTPQHMFIDVNESNGMFSFKWKSIKLLASRYGAIGEKPPHRKKFNQYAAYDRETNHILGLSTNSSFATPSQFSANSTIGTSKLETHFKVPPFSQSGTLNAFNNVHMTLPQLNNLTGIFEDAVLGGSEQINVPLFGQQEQFPELFLPKDKL